MEIDGESVTGQSCAHPSVGIESVFKRFPVVEKGKISCVICFSGATMKNYKRAGFEAIKDVAALRKTAFEWSRYDHHYSSVYKQVDWNSKSSLHAHKKCKGLFCKVTYMATQKFKSIEISPDPVFQDISVSAINVEPSEGDHEIPRRSTRREFIYQSSLLEAKCIICAETKKDVVGTHIPIITMLMRDVGDMVHKAEKKMVEFAKVHIEKKTKYEAAGERILLTLSTSSLFAANVGYHQTCYDAFRSSSWKRGISFVQQTARPEQNYIDEFVGVIEYLVVLKKEVYTLSRLKELYADIKKVTVESLRSIDIKRILEEKLKGKIIFCKPTTSGSKTSEYVVSADANTLPDAIDAIVTGKGISNYLQLKNMSRSISYDIQSHEKIPWPPTPQVIIESEDVLDNRLYNMIAWIVSPSSTMGKDGVVELSHGKATKVCEIVQNIQSLVPGAQPSINQVLLSLNMYAKTGSKMIINDLKHLGHGLSNTETMFIQDKWAEWTDHQKSIIPSNIKKGVITTHIFDNIDWKNKTLNRVETHHTNSILIQRYDLAETLSKVTLDADYNFVKSRHRSYKGNTDPLPAVYFKRGVAKQLKYTPIYDRSECNKSSLKTLAWVESRFESQGKYKYLCKINVCNF